MKKKRLGELLTERGLLTKEQVDEALRVQGEGSGRLAEILAANRSVSKADLGASLEAVNGMPYAGSLPEDIDPEVLALIPSGLAARSCAIPVAVKGSTLVVVMGEPQNLAVVEELEFASGMSIEPRFSFRSDVVAGIKKFYNEQVQEVPWQTAAAPAATPERAPGHLSRTAAAALIVGCGVAAVGTWHAATLVFETFGRPQGVVEETLASVAGGSRLIEEAHAAPDPVGTPVDGVLVPPVSDAVPGSVSPPAQPPISEAEPVAPEAEELPPLQPERVGVGADGVDTRSPATGLSAEIQVGVFRSSANAQRLADSLDRLYDQVELSVSSAGLYVVSLGPFSEKQDADRIAGEIRDETGLVPLVRLTRLD